MPNASSYNQRDLLFSRARTVPRDEAWPTAATTARLHGRPDACIGTTSCRASTSSAGRLRVGAIAGRGLACLFLALVTSCGEGTLGARDARSDVSALDAQASDAAVADAGILRDVGAPDVLPLDAGDGATGPRTPDRVVFFCTPHGTGSALWANSGSGSTWMLSGIQAPLAPLRDRITVIRGLNTVRTSAMATEFSAQSVLLTGRAASLVEYPSIASQGTQAGGPSIDVTIGALDTAQPLRSVYLAAQATTIPGAWVSWLGAARPNPPLQDPHTEIDSLFAGGESTPEVAAVRAEITAGTDYSAPAAFQQALRVQLDVAHALLALDRTRVVTLQVASDWSRVVFSWVPGVTVDFLTAAHTYGSASLAAIQHWFAEQLLAFAQSLDATPTADGRTLLDHTLIVWVSDIGEAMTHSDQNLPVLLIGDPSGRLRTGLLLDAGGRNIADLWLTIAQTLHPEITAFGVPAARPITELTVP